MVTLDFRDTFFFTSANSNLPSAADVLQRHAEDSESPHGIAIFKELALMVKFGKPSHVYLDNALTMRALWQAFPNREIPVPKMEYKDPYRPSLPDTGDIHFAHGDFHLGNVMISNLPGSATVITSVINWEEAG
ncbi:hypothetical protein LA080_015436 [Diaporthe eres]|nr:hypothetical protein LA080_015436 [Diaporthe eres]